MHKYAIRIVKKQAYQIQSNPPQVHKAVSKSMKMLMNLVNKLGKIKRDVKTTHSSFYLERKREDDVGKKQGSYTQTSFFVFLKTVVKQGIFQKKQNCALVTRNKIRLDKISFQDVSQVLHDPVLACVDFQDKWKKTSIEWNLGNKTKMIN